MPTSGPIPAEIAIVVDYPEYGGFNIKSLLERLSKLGILATSCFITTVSEHVPPKGDDGQPDIDEWISDRKTCPGTDWAKHHNCWVKTDLVAGLEKVKKQLEEVKPKLVISVGKLPLLMLTGKESVDSWMGSRMTDHPYPFTIVPVFHPRRLVRQPEAKFILDICLARAYNIYTGKQLPRHYKFLIKPTFQGVQERLLWLLEQAEKGPLKLSGDLETRAGHTACFGIAWSATEAICIPHLVVRDVDGFYWDQEDEAIIISLYASLFVHPNIEWVGQNFAYDCQYFHRHWGILPLRVRDTMVGHHALHSNIKKGLDFLSLMYAQDHVYWKDEIKEWDPKIGEEQYWTYNCKDACITFEIDDEIRGESMSRVGAAHYHTQFQQEMFFPVLRMMNRGVRIDMDKRSKMKKEMLEVEFARQMQLSWVCGHEVNPRSSKQLLKFFYEDMGIPGIKALGKESLTTNSPTMAIIADRYPMLKPLCQLITELRSLGVFLSTFIDATTDFDGRMRTDFAVAGPITYRFASRTNAFGSGMNLQNIPVGEKQKIKDKDYVKLPNIRELFIPDPGCTFFDADLDRADMQIVGWESGDENLKLALKKGIDLHCMSAAEIFGITGIPVDELIESHPNYADHRAKIGKGYRDKTKNGGHACDYGVGDRKLAQTLGITTHEASLFKSKWFSLYPGIRKWHLRVAEQVQKQGYIENPFGARLYNFGRFDLPEFLGWVPQSTVAGVINRILCAIDAEYQAGKISIELLLQVHDSLAGQFPTKLAQTEIANLKRIGSSIIVPYDDPLIIPLGVKTSTKSWGDCK